MDDIGLYGKISENELTGVDAFDMNSSDLVSSEKDIFWFFSCKEGFGRDPVSQIKFGVSAGHYIRIALSLKATH